MRLWNFFREESLGQMYPKDEASQRQSQNLPAETGVFMSVSEDVIQHATLGDRNAQKIIFETFRVPICRVVGRIVGDADADDVAQETFVTAFEKLSQFRCDSQFSTWLYRIAVNKAIRFKQNQTRRATATLSEADGAWQSASDADETAELVKLAMSKLDPELAMILQLKEIDRLSYAEISEIVGIPEGTVGSRLNRARKELRERLMALGWEA